MAEQSDVQQSEVSQSTASLNSILERDFERYFERDCGHGAGTSGTFDATVIMEQDQAALSSATVATERA